MQLVNENVQIIKRLNKNLRDGVSINHRNNKGVLNRSERIAIFAAFNPDGLVPDSTIFYLKKLSSVVDKIIFVADNALEAGEAEKLAKYTFHQIAEQHGEYDFGSYKRGYMFLKEGGYLGNTKTLVLCNDSCVGPLVPLQGVFSEMERRGVDFWGLTEATFPIYHLQSYFISFSEVAFNSRVFKDFLDNVKPEEGVQDVILNYELKLTQSLVMAGMKSASYIDTAPPRYLDSKRTQYHLEYFPILLVESGMPLVKQKALKFSRCNMQGVARTLDLINKMQPELYSYMAVDPQISKFRLSDEIGFTIILPTYNRRHSIRDAIDSVLAQTHTKYELIVVDDGSTDGTCEMLAEFYAYDIEYGRLKIIRLHQNNGVSYARNEGVKMAKYPWIGYVDSDNSVRPYFLSVAADAICENPDKRCFYGQIFNLNLETITGEQFDREKLLKRNYIDIGAFVHARSLNQELGGFDVSMRRLVDWDLILRYTEGKEPVFLERVFVDYNDALAADRISVQESVSLARMQVLKKHSGLPVVTTMIVAYNHKKYIKRSIESALAQKGNFIHEILISDDGSSDGTRKIIEKYARQFPFQIRSIGSTCNVGISANFKRCFEEAQGEYIAILEGDDYWSDELKLEKQKDFLMENDDCSMVFSKIEIYNQSRKTRRTLSRQDALQNNKLDGSDFLLDSNMNLIANFSSCMFRSDLMKKMPDLLFKERISEIPVVFYLEQYGKIGYLDSVMSVYRQHVGGVWTGSDQKSQMENGRKIREVAFQVAADRHKASIRKVIDEKYSGISD